MLATSITRIALYCTVALAAPTEPSSGNQNLPPNAKLRIERTWPRPVDQSLYIPGTNMPMTNIFQGLKDECFDKCHADSVCLRFPWGYQTCFDIESRDVTFSHDKLGIRRQECDLTQDDDVHNIYCQVDQVCVDQVVSTRLESRDKVKGWCVQKNVYDMNFDAFCKGRYQKVGHLWATDLKNNKYIEPPKGLPTATWDKDFNSVNKGWISPADCYVRK